MQAMDLVRHYLGDTEVARTEAKTLERYEEENVEGIVAKPGAANLLSVLPASSVALVTSAGRKLAGNRMRAAGLQMPEKAIFAEDAQPGKPNPLCYQLGARLPDLDASICIVVEDATTGIEAGLSAGAVVPNVGPAYPAHARVFTITGLQDVSVEVSQGGLTVTYQERTTTA